MIKLTKENFEKEIGEYKGVSVIDLWASWCGPCKMLSPVLDELEKEYTSVKFAKINVDEEAELAEMFKVSSIPMVAVVKDNVLLDFTVGYMPREKLAEFISPYINE